MLSRSVVPDSLQPRCLPGSSVHGDSPGKNTGVGCHALLQGSSQPRDWTQVSCTAGRFFIIWATREAPYSPLNFILKPCSSSLIPIIHFSEINCYQTVLSTLYPKPERVQEMSGVLITYLFTEWMNEYLNNKRWQWVVNRTKIKGLLSEKDFSRK